MTRAVSKERTNGTPVGRPNELLFKGLLLHGTVRRRWRRALDSGTEVVNYDVDGVLVVEYNPRGHYFAVGQVVDLPIKVGVYQTKAGVRYNLIHDTGVVEGEF